MFLWGQPCPGIAKGSGVKWVADNKHRKTQLTAPQVLNFYNNVDCSAHVCSLVIDSVTAEASSAVSFCALAAIQSTAHRPASFNDR